MDATISSDHTRGKEEAVLRTFADGKVDPGPPTGPPQPDGRATLDYQMQLMLLEQQNKRRLCMARAEQDNLTQSVDRPGNGPIPPPMGPGNLPPSSRRSSRGRGSYPGSSSRLPPPPWSHPPVPPTASSYGSPCPSNNPPFPRPPTYPNSSLPPPLPPPPPPPPPPPFDGAGTELEQVKQQLERLGLENTRLRQLLNQPLLPNRWIVLHKTIGRTPTAYYKDAPYWQSISGKWTLHGDSPIQDLGVLVQELKWKDTAFIAVFEYRDETWSVDDAKFSQIEAEAKATNENPPAKPDQTSITILCDLLRSAVNRCIYQVPILKQILEPRINQRVNFHNGRHMMDDDLVVDLPYADTIFYHFRKDFDSAIGTLQQEEWKQQLQLLLKFADEEFTEKFHEAAESFAAGYVRESIVRYLFAPATLFVCSRGGQAAGYLQTSFLEFKFPVPPADSIPILKKSGTTAVSESWVLTGESWKFNGKFYRDRQDLTIAPKEFKGDVPIRIQDLSLVPLQYTDQSVRDQLWRRGMTFWTCRTSAYVSYSGLNRSQDAAYTNARFLIDVATYRKIHASDSKMGYALQERENEEPEIGDEAMKSAAPPNDDFVYMVPVNIFGFDMQSKKWVDLLVDNISPVKWDKHSFDTLALDSQSKELITAMVTNKIDADKSTDHIAGKGTGLVLLLHGGPGTGKTLTAESVAELAEKPLYRVTCGDIGTEPRHVEEYLEQVFYLGKIWDCVVLLDEADVFLEQRSLSNLSRNALVSVFLRTLEYYDGILILTSNRVGTFDEAFKSRIQLSLHYPNLDYFQRKQIWKNFIKRLESLEVAIDAADISAEIENLARHDINGRQIRNSITTARQLALYKNEALNVSHLQHSIMVSGKFDRYLLDIHHMEDDEIAREEGLR